MKLFYRKLGEGKPVIVLHGLFGLSDNWMTAGKALAENFSVYLVDLRNHGQSPHSDEFSYGAMSRDVEELLNDLGIERASLIGHSMGGKTAMQVAIDYPGRVEKLVVSDIGPQSYPVHHAEIIDALYFVDVGSLRSRKEAEERLAQKIKDWGVRQFLLKNLYWKEKEQLGWRMNLPVLAQKIDEVGEAQIPDKKMELPALFIRGERSGYIRDNDWPHITEFFPRASLATITGAGHWVHADKPVEFVEAVKTFLLAE